MDLWLPRPERSRSGAAPADARMRSLLEKVARLNSLDAQSNWFDGEPTLQRILKRLLRNSYELAAPRLRRMGQKCATDVSRWGDLADRFPPKLIPRSRDGTRIDEVEHHPAYRWMQEVAYGEGIVAASYQPQFQPEHGGHPKALTFGLGYLLGQADGGMFCPVCMTDGAAYLVKKFASSELQSRFVPRLSSTDVAQLYTGAMFLTEKAGGSDVGQTQTVARGRARSQRLYGEKWFCSNVDADVIMALARPEGAPSGTQGLGLYLLPRVREDGSRNGLRIERLKDKLGVRSMATGEVTLDGAEAFLLGGPGEGFRQMTEMINLSRLYNAIGSVANMRRTLQEAMHWAETRVVFGKKLIEHPLATEALTQLAIDQKACLIWAFRAVELMDLVLSGGASHAQAQALRLLTPLMKYYTGKKAILNASEAMELLGGNGYIEDWPMARFLRDAQVLPIWEGSTNVVVLDAFRALRKEDVSAAFFLELNKLFEGAPGELAGIARASLRGLEENLNTIIRDNDELGIRRWTDLASTLWQIGCWVATEPMEGPGLQERLIAKVARGFPRRPMTPEELRAVVYG